MLSLKGRLATVELADFTNGRLGITELADFEKGVVERADRGTGRLGTP